MNRGGKGNSESKRKKIPNDKSTAVLEIVSNILNPNIPKNSVLAKVETKMMKGTGLGSVGFGGTTLS